MTQTRLHLWEWAPIATAVGAVLVLWSVAIPRLTAAADADRAIPPETPTITAAPPSRPAEPGALLDGVRAASATTGVGLSRWRPSGPSDGSDASFEAVVQGSFPSIGRFVDTIEAQASVRSVDIRATDDASAAAEAVIILSGAPSRP
ncbi:hypothetical protein [Rubricoccus marinus]|uniref:hypothetical protein n=1 Tax=Rubricoccus marinus TaxID=716817 RepID=UPI00117B176A|nr:hypothetical protein [Rubricoccus marinus]